MRNRRNEWAAPARRPESSPATAPWPVEPRWMFIGAGTLVLLMLLVGAVQQWSRRQIPSRTEVQQIVSRLDPACKPILQARFRAKLVRDGRPLTRGEVDDMTSGIVDCAAIDQQMSGLQDG